MKSKWNGVAMKQNNVLVFFAFSLCLLFGEFGCDNNETDSYKLPSFYTYTGYRDWYRFPLKFPYHVVMIDTYERGALEKIRENANVENGMSGERIATIETIALNDDFVAFSTDDEKWGVLYYASEQFTYYDSKDILLAEIEKKYRCNLEFFNLERVYVAFSDTIKILDGQSSDENIKNWWDITKVPIRDVSLRRSLF